MFAFARKDFFPWPGDPCTVYENKNNLIFSEENYSTTSTDFTGIDFGGVCA